MLCTERDETIIFPQPVRTPTVIFTEVGLQDTVQRAAAFNRDARRRSAACNALGAANDGQQESHVGGDGSSQVVSSPRGLGMRMAVRWLDCSFTEDQAL